MGRLVWLLTFASLSAGCLALGAELPACPPGVARLEATPSEPPEQGRFVRAELRIVNGGEDCALTLGSYSVETTIVPSRGDDVRTSAVYDVAEVRPLAPGAHRDLEPALSARAVEAGDEAMVVEVDIADGFPLTARVPVGS